MDEETLLYRAVCDTRKSRTFVVKKWGLHYFANGVDRRSVQRIHFGRAEARARSRLRPRAKLAQTLLRRDAAALRSRARHVPAVPHAAASRDAELADGR